ncbi:MAG: enoyl-CoA hydratase/isomerase family protein [Pseudomonadota bacterium]
MADTHDGTPQSDGTGPSAGAPQTAPAPAPMSAVHAAAHDALLDVALSAGGQLDRQACAVLSGLAAQFGKSAAIYAVNLQISAAPARAEQTRQETGDTAGSRADGALPASQAIVSVVDALTADHPQVETHIREARALAAWNHFPRPCLATCNGASAGEGDVVLTGGALAAMLLSTHQMLTPGCTLAWPEVSSGRLPSAGSIIALARMAPDPLERVNPARATNDTRLGFRPIDPRPHPFGVYLALTGAPLSAHDAHRCGLVGDLCANNEDLETVRSALQQGHPIDPVLAQVALTGDPVGSTDDPAKGVASNAANEPARDLSLDQRLAATAQIFASADFDAIMLRAAGALEARDAFAQTVGWTDPEVRATGLSWLRETHSALVKADKVIARATLAAMHATPTGLDVRRHNFLLGFGAWVAVNSTVLRTCDAATMQDAIQQAVSDALSLA